MPNRRRRTGVKAERPSSCSPVSTLRIGEGACGRGFPAVAMFDLLCTGATKNSGLAGFYCAIFLSRQTEEPHLAEMELRLQRNYEVMGGEWIEIEAGKWVRPSKGRSTTTKAPVLKAAMGSPAAANAVLAKSTGGPRFAIFVCENTLAEGDVGRISS